MIAIAVAVVAAVALAVWLLWPQLAVFADPEEIRRIVAEAGAWGPLIFIGLQLVQVLVAPIPGQVIGIAGGFLFGTWLGLLYAMIGAAIGFTLIFVLARKLGRPFVERFVSPALLRRFDYLAGRGGVFVLFLIFLLPVFPDDIITFIAGLSRIPIPTLLLVSLAGRLPGYAVLSATGTGLALENLNAIIVGAVVLVAIVGMAFWKRDWLMAMARSGKPVAYLRRTWTLTPLATAALAAALIAAGMIAFLLATVGPVEMF